MSRFASDGGGGKAQHNALESGVVDDQVGKQRIIALVCPTEVLPLMLNLAGHRAAIDHPFLDDIKALALPCAQAGVSIEKVPVANISIGDDAGAWH